MVDDNSKQSYSQDEGVSGGTTATHQPCRYSQEDFQATVLSLLQKTVESNSRLENQVKDLTYSQTETLKEVAALKQQVTDLQNQVKGRKLGHMSLYEFII